MLISFAVTAKLICVFVFAYTKSRFSHNEAHTPKTHFSSGLKNLNGTLIYWPQLLNQRYYLLYNLYPIEFMIFDLYLGIYFQLFSIFMTALEIMFQWLIKFGYLEPKGLLRHAIRCMLYVINWNQIISRPQTSTPSPPPKKKKRKKSNIDDVNI